MDGRDYLEVVGLLGIGAGVFGAWGWAIALTVVGSIVFLYAFVARLSGPGRSKEPN